jgi:hypothetical protein
MQMNVSDDINIMILYQQFKHYNYFYRDNY